MSRHRFQHVETFNRNGRVVAHILDSKSGRHHWIHRQGQSLLAWDRQDEPVSNGLLRGCASKALDEHAEAQRERLGRPCTRCDEPFLPKPGTKQKVCKNCISAIGKSGYEAMRRKAAAA